MLLIDGVRYELWTPKTEDEFERVVKEHTIEIFGWDSTYFDRKQKLKSLSGIGSIPDGYALVFEETPHWHIVEVELSIHPLHEHIVSQMSKFINGIKNPNTQREITGAIYNEIIKDNLLKQVIEEAAESNEIYKFLSDLISKPPVLTIVIEKDTEGLREAISTLAHPEIKVVEFQTYTREGVGLPVHAHLFEPVYIVSPPPSPPPVLGSQKLEHALTERDLEIGRLRIPKKDKGFFPAPKTEFELIIDGNAIRTNGTGRSALFIRRNLKPWFRKHVGKLRVGDIIVFTVIEPMKKYRLEIVK